MASLEERLDAVERMIKMPSFRENKGLGNEVGYYVFDYPANQELIVRERIQYMKAKNSKGTDGFELVVFDLYDIIIDLLEQEGFLEQRCRQTPCDCARGSRDYKANLPRVSGGCEL